MLCLLTTSEAPSNGVLAVRAVAFAAGALWVWRAEPRRSAGANLGLTGALLFAAVVWSLPVLGLAAAAVVGIVALRFLRRRNPPMDRFLSCAAGEPSRDTGAVSGIPAWYWCAGGLGLLCIALATLEVRQPYYFCQDDMLVGELPSLLFGLRSVWHGTFPEWNPYQFMGSPYASSGGGRLFYPPSYLAYAFARHVLGNEAAMVDVSAILHLVGSYFSVFWVLRRLGIGAAPAAVGGLSVALSGSLLIMGRGWGMFIYCMVWAPLLMDSVARLARGPVGWPWVLLTGLTIGVLFQIGFVQVWMTILLLMAAAALLFRATGRIPTGRLPWLAAAILLGAAMAAPLMYQQWLLTRDMAPLYRDPTGIFVGLLAMLLPYPLATARHPLDWGGVNSQYMGQLYYFGTLFALLLLLGLAAVQSGRRGTKDQRINNRRNQSLFPAPGTPAEGWEGDLSSTLIARAPSPALLRGSGGGRRRAIDDSYLCADPNRRWSANVWSALALGVLVLALGSDAGVWQLMSALPVLSIVNHYPFRLLPFFTLLAVMAGATVGERLLRGSKTAASRTRWELALALPTVGLLLWHVWFARSSFYQYGFGPTQTLPADLAADLDAGATKPRARLKGWAPQRSSLGEFRLSMTLNLPMADGLLAFDGYDPLIEAKPTWRRAGMLMKQDPVLASKVYGVRWHVLSRLVRNPTFSVDSKAEHYMESSVLLGEGLKKLIETPGSLRVALKRPELTLADAGPVDPLAFPQGRPDHPLPVTISSAGVDIDTSTLLAGDSVVVNWLWYAPFRADAAGRPLACAADEYGRIVISGIEPKALPPDPSAPGPSNAAKTFGTPSGDANVMHVRYRPSWATGVEIGAGLALASCLLTGILQWFASRGVANPPGPGNDRNTLGSQRPGRLRFPVHVR